MTKIQNPSLRIRVVSVIVLVFALVLGVKLYLLQIVHSADYAEKADRQYVQPNQNLFDRGTIFFTAKDGKPYGRSRLLPTDILWL